MGNKLKNPPVFYVLAQFKFNQIAQMADYVPRLQDRLRRDGYPDFKSEELHAFNIRKINEAQPEIQDFAKARWGFHDELNTEGFLLLDNSLVFHTTAYDSFDDFSKKAIKGLDLVHEIVELAFIERIGLRYLDAINPGEKTIQEFLSPSILGLRSVLKGGVEELSFSETQINLGKSKLVSRAVISENGLALPPDLLPMSLKLKSGLSQLAGTIATLDIDCFSEERKSFDSGQVAVQLDSAHSAIEDAFRASVTPTALDFWGK